MSTTIKIFPLLGIINQMNVVYAVKKSSLTLENFDGGISSETDGTNHAEIEVTQNLTQTQKDKILSFFPSCWVEFS